MHHQLFVESASGGESTIKHSTVAPYFGRSRSAPLLLRPRRSYFVRVFPLPIYTYAAFYIATPLWAILLLSFLIFSAAISHTPPTFFCSNHFPLSALGSSSSLAFTKAPRVVPRAIADVDDDDPDDNALVLRGAAADADDDADKLVLCRAAADADDDADADELVWRRAPFASRARASDAGAAGSGTEPHRPHPARGLRSAE